MIKPVDWTPEMIGRFWTRVAETGLQEKLSFAKGAAPFLVPLAASFLQPGARCLDFGGGGGHLAERLIEHGFRASVYEPGEGFESQIVDRLKDSERFEGIVRAEDVATFDCVFSLEVVEHVHETLLAGYFERLNQLTRDDGLLFMSCPNNENLELDHVLCPCCDSYFHRWQHLRSVTPEMLVDWASQAGFDRVWLGLIGFEAGGALLEYVDAKNVQLAREAASEPASEPVFRGLRGRGYLSKLKRALGFSARQEKTSPSSGIDFGHSTGVEQPSLVDLRLASEARIVMVARKRSEA